MAWRSWDRPLVGTIFRLPDIVSLVRGITYTILPDGTWMRVPTMNRLDVRAHANKHGENEDDEVMQALHNLLHGKTTNNPYARGRRGKGGGRGRGPRPVRQQPITEVTAEQLYPGAPVGVADVGAPIAG